MPARKPKPKKVFTATITRREVDVEDSGCAMIAHPSECKGQKRDEEQSGMFVRLHSWSDSKDHSELKQFIGKKIRITVEVL